MTDLVPRLHTIEVCHELYCLMVIGLIAPFKPGYSHGVPNLGLLSFLLSTVIELFSSYPSSTLPGPPLPITVSDGVNNVAIEGAAIVDNSVLEGICL